MESSCILVGNANFKKQYGELINSFDEVVRFNRYRINGFEKYVGTKCTIWVLNNKLTTDGRDFYRKNIKNRLKAHPELKESIVITNKLHNLPILNKIKSKYDNFQYVIDTFNINNSKPSTGLVAIRYFLKKYDMISLVGFDFGKSNHYWGNFGASDVPGKAHCWDSEKEYVIQLVKSNKVKIL